MSQLDPAADLAAKDRDIDELIARSSELVDDLQATVTDMLQTLAKSGSSRPDTTRPLPREDDLACVIRASRQLRS